MPECLSVLDSCHHELVPTSTSVVIQLLTSFKNCIEGVVYPGLPRYARNDVFLLPLEDVTTFLKDPSSQNILENLLSI
ncbi:MAG: hypothetical protein K9G11_00070 [Rickettsiaceae bacterium]|nr:hypothetical protein [Rickettsiaceae bacterium]